MLQQQFTHSSTGGTTSRGNRGCPTFNDLVQVVSKLPAVSDCLEHRARYRIDYGVNVSLSICSEGSEVGSSVLQETG